MKKTFITVAIMIMAITLSGCGKNKSERLNERELEIEQKYGIEIEKVREEDLKDSDPNLIKNNVRKTLSNFIYKRTKRRPMVLCVVLFD